MRTLVGLIALFAIFATMFQSLSRQISTTSAATNSPVFNGTRAIAVDLFGTAGGSLGSVAMVVVVAGALAFAKAVT